MARFDLIDEYTSVFVPGRSRRGTSTEATPPESTAASRRSAVIWGHWMAAAGGFAALVIAMVSSRLSG